MNRRVLVTMLWKDIRELETLTEGFLIMREYPEDVLDLVRQKTIDIQGYLLQLGEFKDDVIDIDQEQESELELNENENEKWEEYVQKDIRLHDNDNPIEELFIPSVLDDSLEEDKIESSSEEEVVELFNQEKEILIEADVDLIHVGIIEDEKIDIYSHLSQVEELVEEKVDSEETHEIANEQTESEEMVMMTLAEVEDEVKDEEIAIPLQTEINLEDENDTLQQVQIDAVVEDYIEYDSKKIDEDVLIVNEDKELATVTQIDIIPLVDEANKEIDSSQILFQPSLFADPEQPKTFGIENKRVTDVKKAISIGERFRFQRELFNGNGEDMNKTLTYINNTLTLAEVMDFLEKKYGWSRTNESAADFLRIVKRKFV